MISEALLSKYSYGFDSISDEAERAVRLAIEKAWGEGLSVAQVREVAIEAIVAASDEYGAMTREMACALFESETGQAASYVTQPTNRETVESSVRYYAGSLKDGTEEGLEKFVKSCTARTRLLTRRCSNEAVIESCAASAKSAKRRKASAKAGHKGVRFARVPRGGDTCTFCAMLASRGFVYWSRKTAGEFNHYHLHCRCAIVPDDGSGEVEGYDPTEWYARWKAYEEVDGLEGLSGAKKRAAKSLISSSDLDVGAAVSAVLDYATAGSVYANRSTDLYRYASRVKPLDGYYDIAIHGDGRSFCVNDADDNPLQDMGADELAAIILRDKRYSGGPIRLLSCNAGQFSDGVAQKLSDALGVEVMGPTQAVNIDSSGNVALADDDEFADMVFRGIIEEPGKWVSYFPNGGRQ